VPGLERLPYDAELEALRRARARPGWGVRTRLLASLPTTLCAAMHMVSVGACLCAVLYETAGTALCVVPVLWLAWLLWAACMAGCVALGAWARPVLASVGRWMASRRLPRLRLRERL
jgi:hypothetical protein